MWGRDSEFQEPEFPQNLLRPRVQTRVNLTSTAGKEAEVSLRLAGTLVPRRPSRIL